MRQMLRHSAERIKITDQQIRFFIPGEVCQPSVSGNVLRCLYFLVMLLDFRRIKRIPMDEALKNVE